MPYVLPLTCFCKKYQCLYLVLVIAPLVLLGIGSEWKSVIGGEVSTASLAVCGFY